MTTEQTELARLRERIDQIDRQLLALICERAKCAQSVAEVKMRGNSGQDVVFYRPEREAQVLRKIMHENPGPLSDEEVARLFREVMSACLALEAPLHIAFLGPEGAFTHAAALKHFGHSGVCLPHYAIDEVFREVEAGSAHYGVVPVETSNEGVISHTLDVFVNSPLLICGEVEVRTHHFLIAPEQVDAADIKVVYSLAQSFSLCRQWLDERWPGVERIAVPSHADAVKRASERQDAAAVAGEHCARLYGMKVLAKNIEDHPDQIARYLIIGKNSAPPSGDDKTSLMVTIRDEPGALYKMLGVFHRQNLSLTRIDSRPALSGARRYHFFVDFIGHKDLPEVGAAIQELSRDALDVRCLGSYPKGVL
ncbi:Prephenate dehydratase [Hahella chejuensis KCTC 2396]|uniref:Bifunctional chorismate mutase/prephenate dehydratase n=1 Tax=Hahella chejuensis (strain KCTC 2396) TaxID=349521 RepID=Q2SCF3_HAHCH|nr:prephenate dehydratase [Hahella chejuensis]ABC31671.1 Prephenate dehydratase [Hahella chejuensis KCTC 2396]